MEIYVDLNFNDLDEYFLFLFLLMGLIRYWNIIDISWIVKMMIVEYIVVVLIRVMNVIGKMRFFMIF